MEIVELVREFKQLVLIIIEKLPAWQVFILALVTILGLTFSHPDTLKSTIKNVISAPFRFALKVINGNGNKNRKEEEENDKN